MIYNQYVNTDFSHYLSNLLTFHFSLSPFLYILIYVPYNIIIIIHIKIIQPKDSDKIHPTPSNIESQQFPSMSKIIDSSFVQIPLDPSPSISHPSNSSNSLNNSIHNLSHISSSTNNSSISYGSSITKLMPAL